MDPLRFERNSNYFESEFFEYLERTLFSDLQLYCSDGCLSLHQLILGSASPMLKRTLMHLTQINGLDNEGATLIMPDFCIEEIEEILPFLYGGGGPDLSSLHNDIVHCLGIGDWRGIYYADDNKQSVVDMIISAASEHDIFMNSEVWNDTDPCTVMAPVDNINFNFTIEPVSNSKKIDSGDIKEESKKPHLKRGPKSHYIAIKEGWKCVYCHAIITDKKLKPQHFLEMHDLEAKAAGATNRYLARSRPIRARNKKYLEDEWILAEPKKMQAEDADEGEAKDDLSMPFDAEEKEIMVEVPSQKKRGRRRIMTRVEGGWECYECKLVLKSREKFQQHQNLAHPETLRTIFTCAECGKTFMYKKMFLAHLKKHVIPASSLSQPSESDKIEMFMCDQCDSVFKKKYGLVDHMKVHEPPKYQCSHCPKQFRTKRGCRYHSDAHEGIANFLCTDCGMGFRNNEKLKHHRRVRHTLEQPFVCHECGEKFYRSDKLLSHRRRVHTGERPYQCEYCDWRGVDSSNLIHHRKKHFQRQKIKSEAATSSIQLEFEEEIYDESSVTTNNILTTVRPSGNEIEEHRPVRQIITHTSMPILQIHSK